MFIFGLNIICCLAHGNEFYANNQEANMQDEKNVHYVYPENLKKDSTTKNNIFIVYPDLKAIEMFLNKTYVNLSNEHEDRKEHAQVNETKRNEFLKNNTKQIDTSEIISGHKLSQQKFNNTLFKKKVIKVLIKKGSAKLRTKYLDQKKIISVNDPSISIFNDTNKSKIIDKLQMKLNSAENRSNENGTSIEVTTLKIDLEENDLKRNATVITNNNELQNATNDMIGIAKSTSDNRMLNDSVTPIHRGHFNKIIEKENDSTIKEVNATVRIVSNHYQAQNTYTVKMIPFTIDDVVQSESQNRIYYLPVPNDVSNTELHKNQDEHTIEDNVKLMDEKPMLKRIKVRKYKRPSNKNRISVKNQHKNEKKYKDRQNKKLLYIQQKKDTNQKFGKKVINSMKDIEDVSPHHPLSMWSGYLSQGEPTLLELPNIDKDMTMNFEDFLPMPNFGELLIIGPIPKPLPTQYTSKQHKYVQESPN